MRLVSNKEPPWAGHNLRQTIPRNTKRHATMSVSCSVLWVTDKSWAKAWPFCWHHTAEMGVKFTIIFNYSKESHSHLQADGFMTLSLGRAEQLTLYLLCWQYSMSQMCHSPYQLNHVKAVTYLLETYFTLQPTASRMLRAKMTDRTTAIILGWSSLTAGQTVIRRTEPERQRATMMVHHLSHS